jgi:MscS family membrane protein
VIDHDVSIDLDTISPMSEGSSSARAPRYEEIGRVRRLDGKIEPLKLVQKDYPGPDARWVFSQSVVNRIDDWYSELDGRWFLDHLPHYLQRRGPYNIMLWQWLALPLFVAAAWFAGYILSRISRRVLVSFTARTQATWDDEFVTDITGPLALTWTLVLGSAAMPWLALPVTAERFGQSLIKGGFLFAFFWALSRLVDAWGKRLITSQWALPWVTRRQACSLAWAWAVSPWRLQRKRHSNTCLAHSRLVQIDLSTKATSSKSMTSWALLNSLVCALRESGP